MPRPQSGMTDSHGTKRPGPLDEYVAAIVGCGGPLTSIVAHMERHSGSAAPIGEVLSGLLSSVLTPLHEAYSDEQLQVAAAILHDTTEIACREIYLVADDSASVNDCPKRCPMPPRNSDSRP